MTRNEKVSNNRITNVTLETPLTLCCFRKLPFYRGYDILKLEGLSDGG
jgi:hypothetical protein